MELDKPRLLSFSTNVVLAHFVRRSGSTFLHGDSSSSDPDGERLRQRCTNHSVALPFRSSNLLTRRNCRAQILAKSDTGRPGSSSNLNGNDASGRDVREPGSLTRNQENDAIDVDPSSASQLEPAEGPGLTTGDCLGSGTAILWFRNDLRLKDNAALALASTAERVVPIYIFDERKYSLDSPSSHGFQRTGPFRAHFLAQSVKALRFALRWKVSELIVRVGITEEIIAEIAQDLLNAGYGPIHVVAQKEVTTDEIEMETEVAATLMELSSEEDVSSSTETHFVWDGTLVHLDDLPCSPLDPSFPQSFAKFRKLMLSDAHLKVREEIPEPQRLPEFPRDLGFDIIEFPTLREDIRVDGLASPLDYPFPDPLAVITYCGGEKPGHERIKEWIWTKGMLGTYFISMDESGNMDFSSKFSAWLSAGCFSPRAVYRELKLYEENRENNKSTTWFMLQLLRRDYFRWVAMQAGNKLFALTGVSKTAEGQKPVWTLPPNTVTAEDKKRFEAWKNGMTGAPYIDSNIRELENTGYISSRGRKNVASFLVYDLKYPDWRAGAEYFESLLIDYDPASNWGNWAHIANVGPDSQGWRPLNVTQQALRYDPTGWFVTRWCFELWQLPPKLIHEPYLADDEVLSGFEVTLGENYPRPVAEMPVVEEWARRKELSLRGYPFEEYIQPRIEDDHSEETEEAAGCSMEENERLLNEMMVVMTSPDDPKWQTPDEIWAREEAAKYK